MCTIIIAKDLHPEWPVLIAANRDEFLNRPATGPQVLQHHPTIIGGRDLTAGGTWMGLTPQGFFAGITNQRTFGQNDPTKKSRGQVVLTTLQHNQPDTAAAWLKTLRPDDYNPFNLLFGTATDLRVAYAHPGMGAPEIHPIPSGLHVLANDVLNSPAFPKGTRAQTLLAQTAPSDLFEAMQHTLADTQAPNPLPNEPNNPFPPEIQAALHALCVHTPIYGTRSATAIALHPGGVAHYRFASGAPDSTPWADHTALVNADYER